MANRFADADNVESLIYQLVGAGSACWENLGAVGVFQDDVAREAVRDGLERLRQLISIAGLS